MSSAASATPAQRRPRFSTSNIAQVGTGLVVLIIYSACLVIGMMYVSYKAPIKQDRYSHPFSHHTADRLLAYGKLFRSPFRTPNATLSVESIDALFSATSATYHVDPCLIHAVALFESGLNPNTITTTGAMGLMALQPETAQDLGVRDPFDPADNLDGGTRLLLQLSHQFNGDIERVLAAYNAGPHAVERANGVPSFRETTEYVKQVGRIYEICEVQKSMFSATVRVPEGHSTALTDVASR